MLCRSAQIPQLAVQLHICSQLNSIRCCPLLKNLWLRPGMNKSSIYQCNSVYRLAGGSGWGCCRGWLSWASAASSSFHPQSTPQAVARGREVCLCVGVVILPPAVFCLVLLPSPRLAYLPSTPQAAVAAVGGLVPLFLALSSPVCPCCSPALTPHIHPASGCSQRWWRVLVVVRG